MASRSKEMAAAAVLTLAIVMGAGLSAPVHAGAWTKRQHEGLFITGMGLHWLEPTNADGPPNRLKREAFLYFEYGLTGRITLQGRGAYQEMRDLTALQALPDKLKKKPVRTGRIQTGFGGLEFGARLRLIEAGRWASSFQLVAGIPGSGENWNNASFGVGGGDLDARLQIGRSVGDHGFFEVGFGMRARRDVMSDEFRLDMSAGCAFLLGTELMVQTYSVWGLGAAPGQPAYSGHRLQVSWLAPIRGRHSVQLSALTTLAHDQMSREMAVMAALWSRF